MEFILEVNKMKFLHYSNSQMKAHSCWFFNDRFLTYEKVIRSLGNFESETKLSKNASRKGQAFSSCIKVASLNWETEVEKIPDCRNDKYVFSDGCGEIQHQFAQNIAKEHFEATYCYAFQIRMGGCKGVLVSSNNEFIGDYKIKITQSMQKFETVTKEDGSVDLEVIRMATYSTGYLNKQIIGILWSNGVNESIFLEMQKNYVNDLLSYFNLDNSFHKDAPMMLFSSVKFINYKLWFVEKNMKCIDLYKDPFTGPLIRLVCFSKFRELRKRFRVFDSKCCVLMGVLDPYGCLGEGEVFIQPDIISHKSKSKGAKKVYDSKPLVGKVLVSRNPCVHNGDVRKLKAVDKAELKGYRNVIIFPRCGERPENDKMASGDLDGDIYWINWNENFIENFIEQPPNTKEETPAKPNEAVITKDLPSQQITRDQCIQNFTQYIKYDLLGEVANLHSQIADNNKEMIKSKECLELAEMHSKAVDFQKHGELLDIDRFNEIQEKCNTHVDFMSADKKLVRKGQIVESPGVLGKMFRALKENIDINDFLKVEYKYKIQNDYKLCSKLTSNKAICKYLPFAYRDIVKPYNEQIHKIMEEKNLFTECDIFNVNCAFSNLVNSRDEASNHSSDIDLILGGLYEVFKYDTIDMFTKEKGKGSREDIFEAIRFVSYFSLKQHESRECSELSEEEGYITFVKMLKAEKEELDKNTDDEEMTYERYCRIVTSTFTEENELAEVIKRSKIFSAWWYLTQYN